MNIQLKFYYYYYYYTTRQEMCHTQVECQDAVRVTYGRSATTANLFMHVI